MTFTFTIDDSNAVNFNNAVCAATGWTQASGIDPSTWVQQQAVAWFKATVQRGLLKLAQAAIQSQVGAANVTAGTA